MANRLAPRSRPRVDLGVDVLDVVPDGLRRDHQALRDLLVRQAAGEQPQDLHLARRQPGRPGAPSQHAVPGRSENRLDRVGVETARLRVGPQLGRRLVGGTRGRGAAAARASPGRRPQRRGSGRPRDRAARPARAGSPSRRAAPGAARRSRRAERGPRTAAACARSGTGGGEHAPTRPAPSGPRLSQIAFEMPSRPRSCTRPARRIVVVSSGSPSSTAARAASSATACAWPSMYGDFRSTKFAIASSAASNCSPVSVTASAGSASITASHVADRVEAGQQLGRLRVDDVAERRDRTGRRGARARAPGPRRPRRRGARPRGTPRAGRAARRAGSHRPELAGPSLPVPHLVGRAERVEHLGRQLELLTERARHRGVLVDHVVHLAVTREQELEADPEAVQRRVACTDAAASPRPSCGCCGARSRTCRP